MPYILQKQILEQLHSTDMSIEKMQLLVKAYWTNMNADIEHIMKQCATCLEYQHTQPDDRGLDDKIPCKPLEVVGVEIFMVPKKPFYAM